MKDFVSDLKRLWGSRPLFLNDDPSCGEDTFPLPAKARVMVLGPHPDDPESVAITSRRLMRNGCDIRYVIVTLGPSGVEDAYADRWKTAASPSLQAVKCQIRTREQMQAAEMFGLSSDHLTFLCLPKNRNETLDSPENHTIIEDLLESAAPDIVILPVGKDTNTTHAWVYSAFRTSAKDRVCNSGRSMVAMYNEDPKTSHIRKDLFVVFGENGARWKRGLLRVHDSQQQRNLHQRQMGFDRRILQVNRRCYSHGPEAIKRGTAAGYAEVFEIEVFDPEPGGSG